MKPTLLLNSVESLVNGSKIDLMRKVAVGSREDYEDLVPGFVAQNV